MSHQVDTICDDPEKCGLIVCRLDRIERMVRILIIGENKIMTTQAEFDAYLTNTFLPAEAARDAAVKQALDDLSAKVAAGATIDLSAELAQITTLQSNAAALTQTATAADPGSTDVTSAPPAPAA